MNDNGILIFAGNIIFLIIFCFFIPTFFQKKIISKNISKKIYFYNFLWLFSIYLLIFSIYFYIFSFLGYSLENIFSQIIFLGFLVFFLVGLKIFRILDFSFKKFFVLKIFLILVSILHFFVFFVSLKNFFSYFYVSGSSMNNSYFDKQILLVNKKYNEFFRFDTVIFKISDNNYYLKRIIGLPNDKIMIENGEVFIQKGGIGNFEKLDEKYLNDYSKGKTYVNGNSESKVFALSSGQYFLMGDNRNYSIDSRTCFGSCETYNYFIEEEKIIGKVFLDLGIFDFSKFEFELKPGFFNVK